MTRLSVPRFIIATESGQGNYEPFEGARPPHRPVDYNAFISLMLAVSALLNERNHD